MITAAGRPPPPRDTRPSLPKDDRPIASCQLGVFTAIFKRFDRENLTMLG